MDPAFYCPSAGDLTVEEPAEHDRVLAALTQATRALAEAQALTQVDLAEAAAVTAEIEALTAPAAGRRARRAARAPSSGPTAGVRNHGNTVTGLRNPFAVFRRRGPSRRRGQARARRASTSGRSTRARPGSSTAA